LLSVVLSAESKALAASVPAEVVLINPADQAAPAGEQWTPFAGAPFSESPWSKMVRSVASAGVEVLADYMLAIDEFSDLNSHLGVKKPHWALAVALADQPRSADDWEVVAPLMLEATPEGDLPDETVQAFRNLLTHQPAGTDRLIAILGRVVNAGASEPLLLELYRSYLAGVLTTREVLLAEEAPAAPDWPSLSQSSGLVDRLLADLGEALTECARIGADEGQAEVVALRALDLLLRVGVPYDPGNPVLDELWRRGVAGLKSDAAKAIVEAAGPFCNELRHVLGCEDSLTNSPPGCPEEYVASRIFDAEATVAASESHVVFTDRFADAADVLSCHPDTNASPRDWTSSSLRRVGRGAPWSIAELAGLAEVVGPRREVDLTAEACSALLEEGLRPPSARLARLIVEHNEATGRVIDDYQDDLLWLARVLGDEQRASRLHDPRTVARVLCLGLRIGLDRNHVLEEQWLPWAPDLVVAAARLLALPSVHLAFPQVARELADVDVANPLSQVISAVGGQVRESLAAAMREDVNMARGVILSAWRQASGRSSRAAVPPDFLSVQVEVSGGRLPLGEAVIVESSTRRGPSEYALRRALFDSVEGADRQDLAQWLDDVLARPDTRSDGPATTQGRIQA
jgi:hypothetical protein